MVHFAGVSLVFCSLRGIIAHTPSVDVGKGRRGRRRVKMVCGLRVCVERQVFMLMWVEGGTSSESGKAISGSCAWDPPGGLLNGLSPLPAEKI